MSGTDILFRYTVAAAGLISLGAYADQACEGKLLRTLLSGVHHEAGEYIGYWDGRDQRGDIVSEPTTRGAAQAVQQCQLRVSGRHRQHQQGAERADHLGHGA